MQLSKQQFNKLPKQEQVRLMNLKQNQQSKKPKPKKGKGRMAIQGGGGGMGGIQRPLTGKQISAAAAYSTGQSSRAPIISMTRDQCRIRHRELLASVTGSTAFTVALSLGINPGLSASFPWLSVMAQAWEEYEFTSLRFCYYTRTGTNIPGSVMMAIDYDAADAAPASEQIASSYEGVVEDAPWKDICCTARKLSMTGPLKKHYTRNSALAANLDIKTYDVGNFFLMTVDGTSVPWGKLWVEYDVVFTLPQLPPNGVGPVGGKISSGGTLSAANPFGDAPTVDPQANGISISNNSIVTFANAGTYLVVMNLGGTVITNVTATLGSNVTTVNTNQVVNTAATALIYWVVYSVALGGSTVTFAATATTVTSNFLFVGQGPTASYA